LSAGNRRNLIEEQNVKEIKEEDVLMTMLMD
jgi:hypothetical protein